MPRPQGGILGKIWSLYQWVRSLNIPLHAANAGYFMVLAVFPALVLVLGLLRYTQLDPADLMTMLQGIIPAAFMDVAQKIVVSTWFHASRTVLSLSAVGALWSASRGMWGLMKGLNAAWGVQETRPYWKTRLLCLGYTFVLLVAIVLTLGLNVFADGILRLIPARGALFLLLHEAVDLRFLVTLTAQTFLFGTMYRVLPNRKGTLRNCLPGAFFAAVGWTVFTELYSLYVSHGSAYEGIFGSVYTIALCLLWLYICLCILFFGAAGNALLENVKKR